MCRMCMWGWLGRYDLKKSTPTAPLADAEMRQFQDDLQQSVRAFKQMPMTAYGNFSKRVEGGHSNRVSRHLNNFD